VAASPTAESTTLWISPAVPPALRESVVEASRLLPGPVTIVGSLEPASLRLKPGDGASFAEWTYAAVAPFPGPLTVARLTLDPEALPEEEGTGPFCPVRSVT